tara:strand:- start:8898 stop:9929 length:1032 start_codon:yes stop_codon:yes gene_type:complete
VFTVHRLLLQNKIKNVSEFHKVVRVLVIGANEGVVNLDGKQILITGGCGFIGSHLAEQLSSNNSVTIVDRSTDRMDVEEGKGMKLIEGDLSDPSVVEMAITSEIDIVFHLAADKAVNSGDITAQFDFNNKMTSNILARMKEVGVSNIAFASSSTVYGEADFPTPENYTPLEPISVYGASKLASEALLSAYAHGFDYTTWIFRFANVVGPRLQRGAVIPDFIEKLKNDSSVLHVLGNGHQEKSYIYIEDCIEAMCWIVEATSDPINTYNIGTTTTISVREIAEIVSKEMGLSPKITYTSSDRGWVGDVPRMSLSVEKLMSIGWGPELESEDAVRKAVGEMVSIE